MAHGWPWLSVVCSCIWNMFLFQIGCFTVFFQSLLIATWTVPVWWWGGDICDARTSIQSRAISLSLFCINSKSGKTMHPFLDLSWTSPSYCIDGGWWCDMCDLFCAAGLNPHTCPFRLGAWLGLMVTATPRRNDVLPFIASEYDHIFFRCFAFICTVDQVNTNFWLTLKWLKEFHHRRHLCNDSDIYISWCDAESD